MQKWLKPIYILYFLLLVTIGACLPGLISGPTYTHPFSAETAAAQTVSAFQTQSNYKTLTAELTSVSEGTSTPHIITTTPIPPTSTATTTSYIPTPVPPTATSTPLPCNWVQFIADVTIPDGTELKPEQRFIKTWRLKNIGSCTWAPDYALVFVSGNAVGGPAAVQIDEYVTPGESIDISVSLIAPDDKGTYTGYWMLRNDNGVVFGIGSNASKSFWVKIKVKEDIEFPEDEKNFAYSYIDAEWTSTRGVLTVPGARDNFSDGSISRTSTPRFEGGYLDNEATLITIPSNGSGGMITGHYPAIEIENGDRFRAIIGCIYDSPDCNVLFQLNYNLEGEAVIYHLGSWTEEYDNSYHEISVDLDNLVGEEVEFHLIVQNNGTSEDDRAFWLMPSIVN